MTMTPLEQLQSVLAQIRTMAIAVSGGVDSVTLALAAGRSECEFTVFHAVSPAVPAKATERVRSFARSHNWVLREIVAGEFADASYIANPYNRCFYCKSNLYGAIRAHTAATIVSGTNLDDLNDYRPGLRAAEGFAVRHPFVEAGIGKRDLRMIARSFGADDLAELPASPCLSSRVETGFAIRADVLAAVDRIEQWIAGRISTSTVRCRIRRASVTVELDPVSFAELGAVERDEIAGRAKAELPASFADARIDFAPYRMGSAFVNPGEGA
jgi:uncharacterized protein